MKSNQHPADENGRLKSSSSKSRKELLRPREKYLLESERIQQEIGNLPQILATLGLSQRRVCQLLLVDPSAWTRWNKHGAPPHIYQALNWLIQLRKINPAVTGPIDFAGRLDTIQQSTQEKIRNLEATVQILERAMTLERVHTSPSPTDFSVFDVLLQEQEAKFTKQISALEEELKSLRAKKQPLTKVNRRKSSKKKPNKVKRKKNISRRFKSLKKKTPKRTSRVPLKANRKRKK